MRKVAANPDINPHICKCKRGSEEPNHSYLLCAVCEYIFAGKEREFCSLTTALPGVASTLCKVAERAVLWPPPACSAGNRVTNLNLRDAGLGKGFFSNLADLSSSVHMEISIRKRLTLHDVKEKGGIFKFMKALDLGWVQNRKNLHIYKSRCPKSTSYTQRLCF